MDSALFLGAGARCLENVPCEIFRLPEIVSEIDRFTFSGLSKNEDSCYGCKHYKDDYGDMVYRCHADEKTYRNCTRRKPNAD